MFVIGIVGVIVLNEGEGGLLVCIIEIGCGELRRVGFVDVFFVLR